MRERFLIYLKQEDDAKRQTEAVNAAVHNAESQTSQPEEVPVEDTNAEVKVNALKVLNKAASRGETVQLAKDGVISELPEYVIANPQQAYDNLKVALKLVKKFFRINDNQIDISVLPGDASAEATKTGRIVITPKSLMSTLAVLAHHIAHEAAHLGNLNKFFGGANKAEIIQDEVMVERYVQSLGFSGDGAQLKDFETEEGKNYEEFINRIIKPGDPETEEQRKNEAYDLVYKLYHGNQYKKLRSIYHDRYVKNRPKEEQEEAKAFFWKAFPFLHYNQKGTVEPKNRKLLHPDKPTNEKKLQSGTKAV